jgi:hypothetical protein
MFSQRTDVPPTIDGMLGGLAFVAPDDAKESLQLLRRLKSSRKEMSWGRAVDLGGGIGRVIKTVLAQHFDKVDLVDQNAGLTHMAEQQYLKGCDRVGDVITCGLQDWAPAAGVYDCVWIQWVAGYVLDPHFINLLGRLAQCLSPGGVLVLKENVTHASTCALWLDNEDASTIRSKQYFQELFALAELRTVRSTQQHVWPADLYPIHAWVLEPAATASPAGTATQDTPATQ